MDTTPALNLLDQLRNSLETAQIDNDVKDGPLGNIKSLVEALREVQERCGRKELAGYEGALVAVYDQLSRTGGAEDTSHNLERVQTGLDGAFQALRRIPPSRVPSAFLQGSRAEGPPGNAEISDLKNSLDTMFRFAIDERSPWPNSALQSGNSGDGGECAAVDSSVVLDECHRPKAAKLYFRYNRMCMEFLQEQMAEARKAGPSMCQAASPRHSTKTLRLDGSAEDEKKAAYYNEAFFHALSLGDTLTRRHAHAFDMEKFYTATEVREGVQKICKILKACMEWWNIVGVVIHDRVPQEAVDEDVRTLDKYLGYILDTLAGPAFDDMPSNVRTEWEQAKEKHRERLQSLKIVPDEEIGQALHQLSGSVYTATYRGREYAVKEGMRLDNVGFARFYTEAAVMESIRSPSVVRVFAVTRSGKLVMEKGETDIMTWIFQHRSNRLKLKLRLLHDAAQSLGDVHYSGLLHRDVRTKIFVVFGGSQPDVKIVGFSKASTGNITAKNTVRKHGKITFTAPEIFEEKPCDMKSDIYSFGIVMYEMIGETLPYGRGTTDAAVISMKRSGTAPSYIPADKYPEELLKLMAECCAVDPANRPSSMGEVQRRLATLLENLDDHEQKPGIAEELLCELPSVKYNKTMMLFLQQQLTKAQCLTAPSGASKDSEATFDSTVEKGNRLIRKHEHRVDISTFYLSAEARDVVELVCDSLFAIVREWELDDRVKIETKVPSEAFAADRAALGELLNFVLKGEHVVSMGVSEIPLDWRDSREEHVNRLAGLPTIDDAEIDDIRLVGEGGFSVVRACKYEGRQLAIKKFVRKGGLQEIEDMAEFFKDVLIQIRLSDEHVAKSYAITESGRLLMELATMDLKAFCREKRLEWPTQLGILLQAGERLRHLHSLNPPLVHCDVKSPNFLVFGSDAESLVVKITDFGLTSAATASRCKTARRPQGTFLWVAPEVYEGKLLSLASDVYSFGMVMYELITGRELYGLHRLCEQGTMLPIMKMKLDGKEPCVVLKTDCPKEMLQLMRECCRLDPAKRPTMAVVCRRLSDLQEHWTDKKLGAGAEPMPYMELNGQDAPTDSKVYFRYNRNCMEFLQEQMAKAQKAALPFRSSKTSKCDATSEDKEKAAVCSKAFDHAFSLGETLTSCHSRAFDMEKFYSSTEARDSAQAVCKRLKSCLEAWNVQGVQIFDSVPQGKFQEDERTLDRHLGYILDPESQSTFEGMPSNIREEWNRAKDKQCERLRRLKIVPDREIGEPQRHLSDAVYVATYRGSDHAVKCARRLDNVGLARFYAEAAVMEGIHSRYVARLYAVTHSGKLVMEQGEMDIMAWFFLHKSKGLKLKIELLRDAARSLSEVHCEGLVHCDICTKRFVVFEGRQPEVKVVGFGKAFTADSTEKNVPRVHFSNPAFMAPEVFEDKLCSTRSDIYSFGIVMYDVMGEGSPYGTGTTDVDTLSLKSHGQAPFIISPDKCPFELLELMKKCCTVDPANRPSSMEAVHQRLAMLASTDDPRTGCTALHEAAAAGDMAIVQLLLEGDAAVDVTNQTGCTPLHEAVRAGHRAIAKLLLERGAAVDATTQEGETPLTVALKEKRNHVVSLLLEWRAQAGIADKGGSSVQAK